MKNWKSVMKISAIASGDETIPVPGRRANLG